MCLSVCPVLGATAQSWKMQRVVAILSQTPLLWDALACMSARHSRLWKEPRLGTLCSRVRCDQPGITPQRVGTLPPALPSECAQCHRAPVGPSGSRRAQARPEDWGEWEGKGCLCNYS